MTRQNPKRRHHHVAQFYLKQWANGDGLIWCRHGEHVFATGTPAVAVEKDFYRLERLTADDLDHLKLLFGQGHPSAVRAHANLVNMLMTPFEWADKVSNPAARVKVNQAVDEFQSQVLEDYHAKKESRFLPILKDALKDDLTFYEDERIFLFLDFISTQYMRTKGIKERSLEISKRPGNYNLSRVWNIIIHISAGNIGASLYVERKRRKLILLQNRTSKQFITGDQPAINLKAGQSTPPTNLSIYYPISPALALILSDVDEEPLFKTESLTECDVIELNKMILDASYHQLFGISEESLKDRKL